MQSIIFPVVVGIEWLMSVLALLGWYFEADTYKAMQVYALPALWWLGYLLLRIKFTSFITDPWWIWLTGLAVHIRWIGFGFFLVQLAGFNLFS